MALDIVVVNYHTPTDLNSFLQSLNRFPPSDEATLTVVDVEAPIRGSEPWAQGMARWISTPDNIGYARACNLGAQEGRGDVLALFNADVEITANSLDFCVAALNSNDDWGVLGPCQVDRQNRVRHAGIFGSNEAPLHRGWSEVYRGQYNDVREAITVSGSAYFIKRSVWAELASCPLYQDVAPDATGAFLPTPHYYEESYCSYHCREHGYRVMYYGPVTMIHQWHRSSPLGGWAEQQMPTSRALFRRACAYHGIACD